jgi:3-oxoacyl-[acyl-carrier-protein] synthase-3
MTVFILDIASFLPNPPVGNDDMERILGMVGHTPSRTRRVILRTNGIHTRHYAIDPITLQFTHNNTDLTVAAINGLRFPEGRSLQDVDCLCCGTATPDQLMPGHGVMVHGAAGIPPCEVISTSGICLSGIAALKYAYMNLRTGESRLAIATGSDHASSMIRGKFYDVAVLEANGDDPGKAPLPFGADFLRWMLSDGAGAILMGKEPNRRGRSLKIEWIDIVSRANELAPCMYAGAEKGPDGRLTGWREFDSIHEAVNRNIFAIKQDVRLLNEATGPALLERTLPGIVQKYGLKPDDITWFLPHYSSAYFRQETFDRFKKAGLEIPFERWFSNLSEKGNTGAASIFIMLAALFHSKKLKAGDTLLCFVPESGRFSAGFALMTVV